MNSENINKIAVCLDLLSKVLYCPNTSLLAFYIALPVNRFIFTDSAIEYIVFSIVRNEKTLNEYKTDIIKFINLELSFNL
jgi:hypothetical protein